MALQFSCTCGGVLSVPEALAGRRVRCPACQKVVFAPPSAVPQATLVDPPKSDGAAPKVEPVTANPPMAKVAGPSCSSRPGGSGRPCCAGGAALGFLISLGSLVAGLVTIRGPLLWLPLGFVGTAISLGALRRLRASGTNPAGVSLARAGVALGVGQIFLSAVVIVGVAFCLCTGRVCHRPTTPVISCPRITVPAPVAKAVSTPVAECRTHLDKVAADVSAWQAKHHDWPATLRGAAASIEPTHFKCPNGCEYVLVVKDGHVELTCPVHGETVKVPPPAPAECESVEK